MNTATKRLSAISITLPFRMVMPVPDGTIGAGDRPVFAYLYSKEAQVVIPYRYWVPARRRLRAQ